MFYLHENEPIAVVALFQDRVDVIAVDGLASVAEEQVSGLPAHQGDEPDHQVNGGPDGDEDEPEPEQDEDLLVDDVHGQDTEAVLVLHGTGRTVLVEGALGDLGKHSAHWIDAILDLGFGNVEHVQAVGGELAVEEEVQKPDLEEHVDNVEELAEDEFESIGVVGADGPHEVVDDGLPSVDEGVRGL